MGTGSCLKLANQNLLVSALLSFASTGQLKFNPVGGMTRDSPLLHSTTNDR